jgi:hypothetical protein
MRGGADLDLGTDCGGCEFPRIFEQIPQRDSQRAAVGACPETWLDGAVDIVFVGLAFSLLVGGRLQTLVEAPGGSCLQTASPSLI